MEKEKIISSSSFSVLNYKDLKELNRKISISLGKDVLQLLNQDSQKIKISSAINISNTFKSQVSEISKAFEIYTNKAPDSIKTYVQSLNKRAADFSEMMGYIKSYPLKNITNQMENIATKQGVDFYIGKKYYNEISKSITNLVVEYSINYEEITIENLCNKEFIRLNSSYYIENEAIKMLNPQMLNSYKRLLIKGVQAFCLDFKAFVNKENKCFKIIEQFFSKLMDKMEILDQQYTQILFEKSPNPSIEENSISFPTYVFKNLQAFQFFSEYASLVEKPEDIGFAFRQMNEVEFPQLIIAKETAFRKWFNEKSGNAIELKSAIKTRDRMGNTKAKETIYNLLKEKYITKPNKSDHAA